jgi:predicted transcriptional regulator
MAARQKATNSDTSDWTLTPQQDTAVDLLAAGHNVTATAAVLGVGRQAVSGWLHHHAGFQAALNQRKQELWQELTAALRALAPRAVAVLEQELERENRLQASVHILRACGVYGMVPPAGPTDPATIALAQRLQADERQHGAAEAELEMRRRAQDRELAELILPPLEQMPGGR